MNPEAARMAAFHALSTAQQAEAVRRLAAAGYSPHGIASATQLSVEMVVALLAERVAA